MLRSEAISPKLGLTLGSTILFTYILMIMGTFVTSTGSGLACPDWPLCYGSVSPPLKLSIWFEWGHRLLGGITGLLILASTYMVWRYYRGLPRLLTLAVLGLLAAGVLLGGLTVLVEAPLLSSFSHVAIISSHLVIATLVLTCLVFTLRYVLRKRTSEERKAYIPLLFGAVYLQVIFGILVRYSGATLACPDFPLCNGAVIPEFTSYSVFLHYTHRILAFCIFITTGGLLARSIKDNSGVRTMAVIFGLVVAQAAFGILIVATGMFLPFIIMHGATGFALLGYLAYQSMPQLFGGREERSVSSDERIRTR